MKSSHNVESYFEDCDLFDKLEPNSNQCIVNNSEHSEFETRCCQKTVIYCEIAILSNKYNHRIVNSWGHCEFKTKSRQHIWNYSENQDFQTNLVPLKPYDPPIAPALFVALPTARGC